MGDFFQILWPSRNFLTLIPNALYNRILKVGASKNALDFYLFFSNVVGNGIIEFQDLKLLSARLNKKYVHDTFFHTKYTTPGPVALILKKLFFLLNFFVNVTMIVVQHTRDRGQETLLS